MAINTLGAPRRNPSKRGRDFQRAPYRPYNRPLPRSPGTWRPAQLPSPMNVAKRRLAQNLLGKAAARFIPGLGWALLAYDVYEWLTSNGQTGGVHDFTNPTFPTHGAREFMGFKLFLPPPNPHTHSQLHASPGTWGTLFPSPLGPLTGARIVQDIYKCTGSGHTNTYVMKQCYLHQQGATVTINRATPMPRYTPGRDPLPWDRPQFEPWFDPSLPPQFQPQAKPDPRWKPRPRPYAPGVDWRYYEGPYVVPSRPFDPAKPVTQPPTPRTRRRPRTRPRLPWWFEPLPRPRVPVPQPVTDPPPWPDTRPGPLVSPGPLPAPGEGPQAPVPGYVTVIDPTPGLAPRPRLRPLPRPRPGNPNPFPAPPRPRDKERKVGMNALGYGWALWLFNFATEARDAVEAIYKALPCKYRSKAHNTPAKKMQAIFNHFDQVDVEAAMTELFLNHLEDYVIGRASGAINKAFGSGDSWASYYRAFQQGNEIIPELGKDVNRWLDEVAKSLSLPRVRCGRN